MVTIGETWRTLVLSHESSNQDIGVFESEKANPSKFYVDWLEMTKVELLKKRCRHEEPIGWCSL